MGLRRLFRAIARRAVRQLAYGAIAGLGGTYRLLKPKSTQQLDRPIQRILVIRLDLLGDVLFSMPAVEALRATYPGAYIAMLTLPYTAPLARLYPFVDEVVAVDTNRIRTVRGLLAPGTWLGYWRAYRHVRGLNVDLCVSVCGRMASLCAFLSGACRSVGYSEEAYPFMLTHPVPGGRHVKRMHEVEYVRRLAQHAGAEAVPDRLAVPVPAEPTLSINHRLEAHGIGRDQRLVVIHAGSVNGSAKRWPAGKWSRFADEMYRCLDARVVLVGAGSDEAIAREVVAGARSPIVSLAGQTSIEELVSLIARADLMASGDSGPLHLATALGRPIVAIYGPTDPEVYGPYHATAPTHVHRKDLACSPCYTMAASAECPLGDPICMRLVTVQQVVASAVLTLTPRGCV